MYLHSVDATVLRADLNMEGHCTSGIVLAWMDGPAGEASGDYVTWRVWSLNGESFDAANGNYFHLSPGHTSEDREKAREAATRDYNDRRSFS